VKFDIFALMLQINIALHCQWQSPVLQRVCKDCVKRDWFQLQQIFPWYNTTDQQRNRTTSDRSACGSELTAFQVH